MSPHKPPKSKNELDWRVVTLCFLLVVVLVCTFAVDITAGAAQVLLICLALIYLATISFITRRRFSAQFNNLSGMLSFGLRNSFVRSPLPVVIIDAERNIVWNNDFFTEAAGSNVLFGKKLSDILTGLEPLSTEKAALDAGIDVQFLKTGKSFTAHLTNFSSDDSVNTGFQNLVLISFVENTSLKALTKLYEDSRAVVAIIAADNLDELSADSRAVNQAAVAAKIDDILFAWAEEADGLLRPFDTGKYLFIFENKYLAQFRESKFEILDRIRSIENGMGFTISVGIGCEGDSFAQNYEYATLAMDMALGRGGDQAVIKTRNNFEFYGGKSKAVEKRTKVKSRIMAEALRSLMGDCDNVIVMGHKFADFDSLGASIGIARIARILGKPVNIVVNQASSLAGPVTELFSSQHEYDSIFVDAATGLDCLKFKTLLVICDVHSPEYLESVDIYKNAGMVAVIDHHRKMADYIANTDFNYHEPYASSTCEIVTELLQYLDGDNTTIKEEAEAMLAGIVLDTKNFCFKTSFRTFEAAAYLRRIGADPIEIKKIFQSGFDSYVRKTEFIQAAEFYFGHIAVSVWDGEPFEDAKAVMAQAADELLSIEGVEASFVLYAYDEAVHISSRSLGVVNVQLIMERLGGGGHQTNAGAQLFMDIAQAKENLIAAIEEYVENQTEE